jgi:lysophospholipase L1-like esterase
VIGFGAARVSRGTAAALMLVGAAATAAILVTPAWRSANAAIDRCGVPEEFVSLARPLPHVAARFAAGGSLTIVALGSSSTSGTGATKPENNYPSRLAASLARRFPALQVRVVNRGIAGEEAPAMANRIDRDVLPEHPDLVIWQLGTNSLLHDEDTAAIAGVVRRGIERIEASGADVMLMNPQYAPAVLQHPRYRDMLRLLDAVARSEDVPLFPRFAAMRHWAEEGRMPLPRMVAPDHLHMTDAGYDCLASQLAASLDTLYRPRS